MSVWPPQGTDVSIRPPRVPTLAKGPHLSGYSKGERLVLGKSIAHDMKSGAEGAHFFGALLLTFSFDKHNPETVVVSGFSEPISFSVRKVGTLHQKRYFAFLCYRGHFLLHKPGVKMMTRGLFHFSGNLIE